MQEQEVAGHRMLHHTLLVVPDEGVVVAEELLPDEGAVLADVEVEPVLLRT